MERTKKEIGLKAYRRIPRIIKITKVRDFKIYCAFNTGEYKIINFTKFFERWNLKKTDFAYPLLKPSRFRKVKLINGTLSWPDIKKTIKIGSGQEFETYLDLDPVVLYESSEDDHKANQRYKIGQLLKSARLDAGLTQQQLAIRSGTTKNYISRIENNRSDIELRTLRKIVEIGLGKNLEIAVT